MLSPSRAPRKSDQYNSIEAHNLKSKKEHENHHNPPKGRPISTRIEAKKNKMMKTMVKVMMI